MFSTDFYNNRTKENLMENYLSFPHNYYEHKSFQKPKVEIVDNLIVDFPLISFTDFLSGSNDLDADVNLFHLPLIIASEPISVIQFFGIIHAHSHYYTRRSEINSFELRYTLSGHGILEYEGKTYQLSPGKGFIIDCRKPHYYRTNGKEWVCTVLGIDGAYVREIYSEIESTTPVIFDKYQFSRLKSYQYELLRLCQNRNILTKYLISNRLNTLITHLLFKINEQKTSQHNKISEQVLQYLNDHSSEQINLTQLAENLYISRSNLFTAFKQATGDTPYQYLQNIRIKKAQVLLKISSKSIEEIAWEVGFRDVSHFTQTFKKYIGITPLKYRKQ